MTQLPLLSAKEIIRAMTRIGYRTIRQRGSYEPISKIISAPIAKFWLQLVKKSSRDTPYIAHFF